MGRYPSCTRKNCERSQYVLIFNLIEGKQNEKNRSYRGDFTFQQKCKARMTELLSGGTTLLFVSHSLNQVKELCQYAVWIEKGEIKSQGKVEDIAKQYMKANTEV